MILYISTAPGKVQSISQKIHVPSTAWPDGSPHDPTAYTMTETLANPTLKTVVNVSATRDLEVELQ